MNNHENKKGYMSSKQKEKPFPSKTCKNEETSKKQESRIIFIKQKIMIIIKNQKNMEIHQKKKRIKKL